MLSGYVSVSRRRRASASVDQYGEAVPGDWESADLPVGLYAPATSTEPVEAGASAVVTPAAVYWRGQHPDVVASDRLVLDGIEHSVVGRPRAYPKGLQVDVEAIEERGV